jgi:hypothetical protein
MSTYTVSAKGYFYKTSRGGRKVRVSRAEYTRNVGVQFGGGWLRAGTEGKHQIYRMTKDRDPAQVYEGIVAGYGTKRSRIILVFTNNNPNKGYDMGEYHYGEFSSPNKRRPYDYVVRGDSNFSQLSARRQNDMIAAYKSLANFINNDPNNPYGSF